MKKLTNHQLENLSGRARSLPLPIPMPGPNDPICGFASALSVAMLGSVGSAGLTISKEYCDLFR